MGDTAELPRGVASFQHLLPQFGQRQPPIFAEIKIQTGIQIPAVITLKNKCSR